MVEYERYQQVMDKYMCTETCPCYDVPYEKGEKQTPSETYKKEMSEAYLNNWHNRTFLDNKTKF